MLKTQPIIYLRKIKQKGSDYIQWSIEYTRKKLNLTLFNIEDTETAIAGMKEIERKLFIAQLNSALRSKENRKRKTSGSNGNEKSAFQVYISPATIKKVTSYAKLLCLTKSEYIEKLIDEEISINNYYKDKQKNMKNQNQSSPTKVNPDTVKLERELKIAQEQIEYLKKVISTYQTNQQEADNQKENKAPQTQQSMPMRVETEEHSVLDTPKVTATAGENIPRTYRLQRKGKKRNFNKLENPSPT